MFKMLHVYIKQLKIQIKQKSQIFTNEYTFQSTHFLIYTEIQTNFAETFFKRNSQKNTFFCCVFFQKQ